MTTSSPPSFDPSPSPSSSPGATLLALETSTAVTRVALFEAPTGVVLASAEALAERHSSNLLRLCVEVVERAGMPIAEVGAVACSAGPGSFTGLRVGLAVSKGLAMPRGLPLVTVSSLMTLALDLLTTPEGQGLARETRLVPCLDAGKGQVFATFFQVADLDAGAAPPLSVVPEALAGALGAGSAAGRENGLPTGPWVLFGPGAEKHAASLLAGFAGAGGGAARVVEVEGPTASSLGRLALRRLARGERDDLDRVVPVYGRPPDITRTKSEPPPPSR